MPTYSPTSVLRRLMDSDARVAVWAVVSFWKEKRELPSWRTDWVMLRSRA